MATCLGAALIARADKGTKRTKTRVISSRLDLVSVSAQVSNLFSSVRFHEVLASVVDTGKSHQMTFFRPADS